MANKSKEISNPFSTGGGGAHFEAHIQACFVALMLSRGHVPNMPCWPIKEIALQGKRLGYETDDLVLLIEDSETNESRRLLGQVKHSITITKGDSTFGEVIQAAWTDFNNSSIFNKRKDIIALITSHISATDHKNVQFILRQAKYAKDSLEFFTNVRMAKFSPSQANNKLDVFKLHLKNANNGTDLTDEELYNFLGCFQVLGYDLGDEKGVVLSLIHSHISQFQNKDISRVWSRIVDVVQSYNQSGTTITRDNLPEDLLKDFAKHRSTIEIPSHLKNSRGQTSNQLISYQHSSELALLLLIGGWSEQNENDKKIVSQLLNKEYEDCLPIIKDISKQPNSPLVFKNGAWLINEKIELLKTLGSLIFDNDLDNFKTIVELVLNEEDPAFELSKDERYLATIQGKVTKYSGILRQNLAESMALTGNHAKLFTQCTPSKAENIICTLLRELLSEATWQQWATLNTLLPNLAEANPNEFLKQIENALSLDPCPFDEIFAQEGSGFGQTNYITGLLWGLEALAWNPQHLVRVVCILGELARHDTGGNWVNRPINSLTTILLPWRPQTTADLEKRKTAITTVVREEPDVGWNLLLELLPNKHLTAFENYKPKWQNIISSEWEANISNQEYWEQNDFFGDLIVGMTEKDIERNVELIKNLDNLPEKSFEVFIDKLSSETFDELSEENKKRIWNELTVLSVKHRKFTDAEWVLPSHMVDKIEDVSEKFAPKNPFLLYQYLFSERDFELYESNDDFNQEQSKLDEKRKVAIEELLTYNGIEQVIEFVQVVSSPQAVGYALASISNNKIDEYLLPSLLTTSDNKLKEFLSSYILKSLREKSWNWVDNINRLNWSEEDLGQFLSYLPFSENTWERVESWLSEDESKYWTRTFTNALYIEKDIKFAVDKLLHYERPRAALRCISSGMFQGKNLDSEQCIEVLLASLNSKESINALVPYEVVKLIKYLQSKEEINQEALAKIEWAYLPWLDYKLDARPRLLEWKLGTDASFFCQIIQLIYKSNKAIEEKSNTDSVDENKRRLATNAWQLLHNWKSVPGTNMDGFFDSDLFQTWIKEVEKICIDSGHYEVAMQQIGSVLNNATEDSDGLWIDRTVAATLNDKDAGDLRRGYSIGSYNSRGAHLVDPTGEPEKKLAIEYHNKAEAIENAGYHRFAVTLRELANGYKREAEGVISDYKDN